MGQPCVWLAQASDKRFGPCLPFVVLRIAILRRWGEREKKKQKDFEDSLVMQPSIPTTATSSSELPSATHQGPTPDNAPPGYQNQHGSGAVAPDVSTPAVPGSAREPRRAVEVGSTSEVSRKRLAAAALSPDPKGMPDDATQKLQDMVVAYIPKEVKEGLKDVQAAVDVTEKVKLQEALLQQHSEAIRILREAAVEQDNRLRATITKLNLTVAATDKLDDAVEFIEVDHAALSSDLKEFKGELVTKEEQQDAKLERLVEQRHIDVRHLTTELETKMTRVEATFMQVEALLFRMTTDRAAFTKLLDEVQATQKDMAMSISASGAVQPSTGSQPGFGAMAVRMDKAVNELSAQAAASVAQAAVSADLRQNLMTVEDKLVALEVSQQGAVAQITEFVLTSLSRNAQEISTTMGERERGLCSQIEVAMVELSKGVCKCPANCTGAQSAFPAMPPGMGAGTGSARAPFLNRSTASASGLAFNAADGNSGLGGGEPPRQPPGGRTRVGAASYDIHSDDGQKKLTMSSKCPFESRAAKEELPRFNGKDKADFWRKKVTYYLHSRNANMSNLLRWAELQTAPIDGELLAEACQTQNSLAMLSDEPDVLSYHLWGFLNVNLIDAAWDIFNSVPIENGLEVWRLVNMEVTQITQPELLALEDAVLTPVRLTEIKDIERGLIAWDAALRNYLEAGGTELSKQRQVGAIMRLIPLRVRDQALWEFDKFDGKPAVLRKWIRDRTSWFLKADVGRHAGRVHMLDNEAADAQGYDGFDDEELFAMAEMGDAELCAFVRRRFQRGSQQRGGGAGAKQQRDKPPRDVRDKTCPNCLKKGHTSQECRAPKVEAKDRKCFTCGEGGHIASKCPNKDRAAVLDATSAAAPAAAPDAGAGASRTDAFGRTIFMGCFESVSPALEVKPRRTTPMSQAVVPPRPRGCTFGDCMNSVFVKMAQVEAREAQVDADSKEGDKKPKGAKKAKSAKQMPPLIDSDDESVQETRSPVKTDALRINRADKKTAEKAEARMQHYLSALKTPGVVPMPIAANELADAPVREPLRLLEGRQQSRTAIDPSSIEAKPEDQLHNFFGIEAVEQLHALPETAEPEFIEVKTTLDTGATTHATNRVDFPGCEVRESAGSKAGQMFQAAGGKTLPNEGESTMYMVSPEGTELCLNMQIAEITRPLISVTKMTEKDELAVLCKKDVALVLDRQNRVVTKFHREGGLYVCYMKYRNPRYKPAEPFTRPHV